ncbi:TBC1 domain family member 1 isoform X2 [Pieris brassicae]|uniref:TBC1 domain family member 1 isoform X2 n=1 Tax=Pieris brassicae TaxID=7116 RepID=UPI001E660775|nr:TBC1 domain family member 1 isoform X2 [Pieris brassicae]
MTMKTRLTSVLYLGYTAMDRRFSTSMLPWLLKEIRATGVRDKLSIAIEDGCLKAYNENFEPVIIHRLVDILRASQVPGRADELFYILLNEKEGLLQCFLFKTATVAEVTDLFNQMRDPSSTASTPKGSTGSLNITRNVGFQQQNGTEHLPWASPAISLPGNCNSNLALVRSVSNASALTSLCAGLSPSESHFFEVLYIGKVRISQRKVPESLIDDALHKFAQHEAEKTRLQRRHSLLSSTGTTISNNSIESLQDTTNSHENFQKNLIPSTTPLEPDKTTAWKSAENLKQPEILVDREFDAFTKERIEKNAKIEHSIINNLGTVKEDDEINTNPFKEVKRVKTVTLDPLVRISDEEKGDEEGDKESKEVADNERDVNEINFTALMRNNETMPENKRFLRDRSASIGTLNLKTPLAHLIGEQNRTMLFQVGRSELRLISPDRKQILLHRGFKDVASCVLGRARKEHFGFVCRETNDTYACYVFKCESDDIASEVVSAIKQAFVAHAELLKKSRDKSPNMTCEHCPMLWYHRLCHDVEGMNEKKTHAFLLRRMETLPEDEQELVITKYQGGTNHMFEVNEHNAFLMMLLRAHCEAKQQRHVHDTAENRSEFLNQYLGGSTIFMKAKRSLSSGFDHLLKRKQEAPVIVKKEQSPKPPPLNLETSSEPNNCELLSADVVRCKSLSPAVVTDQQSPKSQPMDEQDGSKETTPTINSPMMDIFLKVSDSRPAQTESSESDTTWRQAIYEKVVQHDTLDGDQSLLGRSKSGKRSKDELRQLWKMAIDQTILLVRMEKENARLKESAESSAVRRIKLEYRELSAVESGVSLMWDSLLSRDSTHPVNRVDRHMLIQAVRQGVPRIVRGGVWYFLAEQACLRLPPPDTKNFPDYNTPYRTLLSGLTKHQHAILIDLGRTFPKHSYFASALGPGQLALYNILKAYSLLDPDVGYCQGLSFVAGVLLLHMEEAEAFLLLRHLMFRRGLRKQYLPDMSALQVKLYQLSRLLRDHEPELHAKLEALDISPALYAAPWMLTLFTSQFPLGFVVRVFDMVFVESLDVVFSISLALLSAHRDGIMMCESCEEAAEYLKHKLPDVDTAIYNRVMKIVHKLDISRQLTEYAVEYSVLREEMPRLATLTEQNRLLVDDVQRMTTELDAAMEALTNYQKSQARLDSQNKLMEQHLTLLSRYISNKHDVPLEIKRIVQNYTKKLSFSSKITSFTKFSTNEEEETKQKSAPNLYAKTTKEDVLNAMRANEDRKHFLMKKSQSVHSGLIAKVPLKVLEETETYRGERKHSLTDAMIKDLGKKHSITHEQIRQERLFEQQLKHNFDENLRKLEQSTRNSESDSESGNRNVSEDRNSDKLSLHFADRNDSGFVTPVTPEVDRKSEMSSVISHPLSDCDVDIKFDGQSTKLKQIRPLRHH